MTNSERQYYVAEGQTHKDKDGGTEKDSGTWTNHNTHDRSQHAISQSSCNNIPDDKKESSLSDSENNTFAPKSELGAMSRCVVSGHDNLQEIGDNRAKSRCVEQLLQDKASAEAPKTQPVTPMGFVPSKEETAATIPSKEKAIAGVPDTGQSDYRKSDDVNSHCDLHDKDSGTTNSRKNSKRGILKIVFNKLLQNIWPRTKKTCDKKNAHALTDQHFRADPNAYRWKQRHGSVKNKVSENVMEGQLQETYQNTSGNTSGVMQKNTHQKVSETFGGVTAWIPSSEHSFSTENEMERDEIGKERMENENLPSETEVAANTDVGQQSASKEIDSLNTCTLIPHLVSQAQAKVDKNSSMQGINHSNTFDDLGLDEDCRRHTLAIFRRDYQENTNNTGSLQASESPQSKMTQEDGGQERIMTLTGLRRPLCGIGPFEWSVVKSGSKLTKQKSEKKVSTNLAQEATLGHTEVHGAKLLQQFLHLYPPSMSLAQQEDDMLSDFGGRVITHLKTISHYEDENSLVYCKREQRRNYLRLSDQLFTEKLVKSDFQEIGLVFISIYQAQMFLNNHRKHSLTAEINLADKSLNMINFLRILLQMKNVLQEFCIVCFIIIRNHQDCEPMMTVFVQYGKYEDDSAKDKFLMKAGKQMAKDLVSLQLQAYQSVEGMEVTVEGQVPSFKMNLKENQMIFHILHVLGEQLEIAEEYANQILSKVKIFHHMETIKYRHENLFFYFMTKTGWNNSQVKSSCTIEDETSISLLMNGGDKSVALENDSGNQSEQTSEATSDGSPDTMDSKLRFKKLLEYLDANQYHCEDYVQVQICELVEKFRQEKSSGKSFFGTALGRIKWIIFVKKALALFGHNFFLFLAKLFTSIFMRDLSDSGELSVDAVEIHRSVKWSQQLWQQNDTEICLRPDNSWEIFLQMAFFLMKGVKLYLQLEMQKEKGINDFIPLKKELCGSTLSLDVFDSTRNELLKDIQQTLSSCEEVKSLFFHQQTKFAKVWLAMELLSAQNPKHCKSIIGIQSAFPRNKSSRIFTGSIKDALPLKYYSESIILLSNEPDFTLIMEHSDSNSMARITREMLTPSKNLNQGRFGIQQQVLAHRGSFVMTLKRTIAQIDEKMNITRTHLLQNKLTFDVLQTFGFGETSPALRIPALEHQIERPIFANEHRVIAPRSEDKSAAESDAPDLKTSQEHNPDLKNDEDTKVILDDDLDEIAAEKQRSRTHEVLSIIYELERCWTADQIYDVDFIVEPRTNEKESWSPPIHCMQDLQARKSSFMGMRNRRFDAEDLSLGGFYLSHNNIIECYSCQAMHLIEGIVSAPINNRWHHPGCQHLLNIGSNHAQHTQSDGRVSDDIADPPGQQSIYIPPGDIRREAYRLSTFEQFPVTCAISRKSLAKSGFYFTGFYDRVKCFACARTVERWEEIDNPAELKWHKTTCPLPRGEECGNVPIPSLFQAIAPAIQAATAVTPAATTPSTSANPTANQAGTTQSGERILEQRDPNTGAIIRRVRYPADLPERIRQTGGTFEIGPNNEVIIRSGPGPGQQNPANVGTGAQSQPRRQWRMANVISADHKRFLTNLFLNRELDRLASFARWPVTRPNIAPAYLAKSGFFYLGDMDRTQCFSCGGVLRNWKVDDDAAAEHRTHFPQCRMVLGVEPRNIPLHEHPETEEEKEERYPCRFPSNPHMRSEQARLGTFDRRWPMGRTAATPAEIAQGGFFFLGERDRAKCWYCNGGLQNWEYDDIPWIEHAKWFPNCQFLLRVKGQHFVYRHLALNPHLARPIIARQDGSPLESVGQPAQAPRVQDIPPREPEARQPTPPPTIIDPQEEMRKRKERVQNIMRNSDLVKNVLAMGFDDKIVAALLEDKINSGNEANPNDIYETASQLLDDVFKKEEEVRKANEERSRQSSATAQPPSLPGPASMGTASSMYSISGMSGMSSLGPPPGSGKYNVSYYDDEGEDERMDQDMYGSMEGTSASITSVTAAKRLQGAEENPESLREALNKIEEERMCKICFTNQADMVFVPCSHMCCCMECTQAIRQCPVCRKKIDKAIKTYLN